MFLSFLVNWWTNNFIIPTTLFRGWMLFCIFYVNSVQFLISKCNGCNWCCKWWNVRFGCLFAGWQSSNLQNSILRNEWENIFRIIKIWQMEMAHKMFWNWISWTFFLFAFNNNHFVNRFHGYFVGLEIFDVQKHFKTTSVDVCFAHFIFWQVQFARVPLHWRCVAQAVVAWEILLKKVWSGWSHLVCNSKHFCLCSSYLKNWFSTDVSKQCTVLYILELRSPTFGPFEMWAWLGSRIHFGKQNSFCVNRFSLPTNFRKSTNIFVPIELCVSV